MTGGPFDPTTFFAAVAEYNSNADDSDTARKLLLGTVSALPSGLVQVIFDGETVASSKPYGYLNRQPAIGSRVVLMPIANTHVVIGELNPTPDVSMPRGLVGIMRKTTNSPLGTGAVSGASAVKVMNVLAPVKAGRHYMVELVNLGLYSDSACEMRAVLTFTTNGSEPIQTSPVLTIGQVDTPAGGRVKTLDVGADYKPTTDHNLRVGVCIHPTVYGGSGNWGSYAASATGWINFLKVTDMGLQIADNGSSF